MITIGNDVYNIEENFLEIAKKYWNIDDINILKTGLFGYINELFAVSTRNAVYHRDALYDETFLNTASLPNSIYNFAKQFNHNVITAIPAVMSTVFGIAKKDLISVSTVDSVNKLITLTLPKSTKFYAGKIPFMLPYDVEIIGSEVSTSSEYAFSAIYKLDTTTNDIFNNYIITPYIKLWIENEIVYLDLQIFQMEKFEKVFEVYSSDITENISYDIQIENQLATFDVNYKRGKEDYRIIPKYFNNVFTPDENEYCFYSFNNNNELQVFFSTLPNNFRPQFNSILKIDMYETLGSGGNFSFTGNIVPMFESKKLKDLVLIIQSISDSAGGSDTESLKEIKETLIKKFLKRDNLITEYDLNLFFNDLIQKEVINSSKLTFKRKRDDVLRRTFASFLLLRDVNKMIIPTNTIDLFIENWDGNKLSIPAGTYIVYDEIEDKYKLETTTDIVDLRNTYKYIYINPFLLNVQVDPFTHFNIVSNSISKTIQTKFMSVNSNVPYEFLINNVNINRDPIISSKYEIDFKLNTNLNAKKVIGSVDNLYLDKRVDIKGILKTDTNIIGYFDFKIKDQNSLIFSTSLTTNDLLDEINAINIIDSIYDINTNTLIPNCFIPPDIILEIQVLYNDVEDKSKFNSLSGTSIAPNFCSAIVVDVVDKFSLAKNLNSIMECPIKITNSTVDSYNVEVTSLPVVSEHYFYTFENYKELYVLLDKYSDILYDNFYKLENNTRLDLKFFNTYGISKHYSTNSVNLSIELNVKLNVAFSKKIDFNIKNFIKDFVETTNDDSDVLAISNLIKKLEETFPEIKYIEFKTLNGSVDQKIYYNYINEKYLSKEQLIKYVPEYLNIEMKKEDFYKRSKDEIDTNITIKYI